MGSQTLSMATSTDSTRFKPNMFLAVQINNPDIKTAMKEVQDKSVEYDKQLTEMVVPLNLAHVTLLVLHAEQEEIEAAKVIVADVIKNNDIAPFDVKFEGLEMFNKNEILFAKPTEGSDDLKNLNKVCL